MSSKTPWILVSLWVVLAGCSTGARRGPASPDPVFAFVALPDTQYYSARLPEAFLSQTRWIVKHAKELNIQFVLGLGDIVDDGKDLNQWHNAMDALNVLQESGMPTFLVPGNHDYNPPYLSPDPNPRNASQYNRFVGPEFYKGAPSYRESMEFGKTENYYGTMRIADKDLLILALEFSPRDVVLQWASGVLAAHPFHEVIVITHSYLFSDDTRMTACGAHNRRNYGLYAEKDGNDGEEVWNKFVSQHPNIRLVLSGHVQGGGARRFDVGKEGNLVNTLLSDYQDFPNAGNGWLRIMTVHPAQNRIDVQTFSPYLEDHPTLASFPWLDDPRNQFSIPYEMPTAARFASGKVVGRVVRTRGTSPCAGVAGALVQYPGGTVLTDKEGRFTAEIQSKDLESSRVYQSVELKVMKAGWQAVTYRATVGDGAANAEQIILSPLKK